MKYKIIVDKQSRNNPSNEKKEYEIDIEELRAKGNVYDSLVITKDEDYVIRRVSLSKYHVLSVLEEPIKEQLQDINIELFEGDNYIYLVDMEGNKFYAEYLVKNDFNDLYVTKDEMNSSINQTAQNIELSVNQKLEGYSTTQEMNSAIEVKADSITSSVSTTYATKNELNTAKSEIKQTTDGITSTVSSKVGNNEIISKINQSAEQVQINANKVSLNGKEINLTGDNVVIKSSNFNVNKNGDMTCSNANITGGKISLKDNGTNDISDAKLLIEKVNDASRYAYLTSNQIYMKNGGSLTAQIGYNCVLSLDGESGSTGSIGDGTLFISMPESSAGALSVLEGNTYVRNLQYSNISQYSLEELKKNIVKLNENAIDIVNNSELYIFNYNEENDTDKKHIGFVIGEKYKTPKQIISKDNKGIDLANMSAILWKAIQELAQKNELLEERIKLLEKEMQNGNN